jgi:hypothetical protein
MRHKEAESAESLLWGGRFFHVILAQARTWDLLDLLFVLRDQCKAAKRPNKQPERGHDWSGCVYPKQTDQARCREGQETAVDSGGNIPSMPSTAHLSNACACQRHITSLRDILNRKLIPTLAS